MSCCIFKYVWVLIVYNYLYPCFGYRTVFYQMNSRNNWFYILEWIYGFIFSIKRILQSHSYEYMSETKQLWEQFLHNSGSGCGKALILLWQFGCDHTGHLSWPQCLRPFQESCFKQPHLASRPEPFQQWEGLDWKRTREGPNVWMAGVSTLGALPHIGSHPLSGWPLSSRRDGASGVPPPPPRTFPEDSFLLCRPSTPMVAVWSRPMRLNKAHMSLPYI